MPRVTPRFAGSPPNLRLPLIWNSGLGALTHVQLPADQTGTIAVSTKAAADAAQAGSGLTVRAAPAIAGTVTEGAAAGGTVTIQAGDAARLTSGNANGGPILLSPGTGIGTGVRGLFQFGGQTSSFPAFRLSPVDVALDVLKADASAYAGFRAESFHLSQDTSVARAAAGVLRATTGYSGNESMGKVMAEEFQVSSDSSGYASRAKFKVTKVTKAHNSDLFNAAGLTDSVVVYTQPANSILIAAYAVLDTQFAAVGMTDLDVTLGDAGNNAGILNATGNYTSDAATTKYATKGAYFEATAGMLLAESASDITAYATAVGANLDTTSAGSVSFYFVTFEW